MIINISELTNGETYTLSFNEQLDKEKISFQRDVIDFSEPVEVSGKIYLKEKILVLRGNIKTKIALHCARCLNEFLCDINFKFDEEILVSQDGSNILENEKVDLSNLILENILLNIPIKPLCKVQCKGLCSNCGQNLNNKNCNCQGEYIDPRLTKLKDFFEEDKEV